jgi:hypothetical protein
MLSLACAYLAQKEFDIREERGRRIYSPSKKVEKVLEQSSFHTSLTLRALHSVNTNIGGINYSD